MQVLRSSGHLRFRLCLLKRLAKRPDIWEIFDKWPFFENFKGVNRAKWSKLIDLSLNFINPVKVNVNRRWPFDFVVAQDLRTSFSYTVFIFSSPWIYQQTTFFLSYLGKRKVPFQQVGGYLQIHNLSPDCDRFLNLEPEASVKLLSLIIACGLLSVVMIIIGSVYITCYENRRPKIRTVLRRKLVNNHDQSFVWRKMQILYTKSRWNLLTWR